MIYKLFENGMTNFICVLLQMIAIVAWFILLNIVKDKKKYLNFRIIKIIPITYAVSISVLSITMIYTLLSELLIHKFNLSWNLNTWYLNNLLIVVVIFFGISRIEEKQDKIDD